MTFLSFPPVITKSLSVSAAKADSDPKKIHISQLFKTSLILVQTGKFDKITN